MDKRRPKGSIVFGVICFIFGIISIGLPMHSFMKTEEQYKQEDKLWIMRYSNKILSRNEKSLETITKKLNRNLSPKAKEFLEYRQRKIASRIEKIKLSLELDSLEDRVNKLVGFRVGTVVNAMVNVAFGIILLVSSIGIFLGASWLKKLIYLVMPFSIIVYLLGLYVSSYINPLLYPIDSSEVTMFSNILTAILLIGYNTSLYRFTHPKVKRKNSEVKTETVIETNKLPKSGLAISSFILGLTSFIPLFGVLLAVIGIVLGIVGLLKIKKQGFRGKGLAKAGIVLGILGILLNSMALVPIARANVVAAKGQVFYERARYDEAAVSLENAIKIKPEFGLVHYYLALTYVKLGRREKAMDLLQSYRSYGKKNERRLGIMDKEYLTKCEELLASLKESPSAQEESSKQVESR